jgi:hypothetical protein
VNPTVTPERKEADQIGVSVFDYDKKEIKEISFVKIESCEQFKTMAGSAGLM